MEQQLRAFGYGMADDEKRNGSGKLAAAAGIGVAGAVGYAKRKQIAGGVSTGMNYAGDALRKRAALGPAAQVLNPKGLRKATGQAGDLLLRGAKKLKGFRDLDAIIDLAARVAQMELEAEEELKEFGSVEQMTRRGQGLATSVLNKKRTAMSKVVETAKANPGMAKVAGALSVGALAGGAMRAHDRKQSKRREELLSRFKGKATA